MKIDLEIHILNGRVMLEGKTYEELNDDEKLIMNGLIKEKKLNHKYYKS